jgi:hypothetical protein
MQEVELQRLPGREEPEPPEREKRFMFVRCSYPECHAILTKEAKNKGGCECGLNKFRGVPLGQGKLKPGEEKLFEQGLVHYIDIDMVPPDPDLLNVDNDKYWERVTETFGRQRSRARRRKADKKRGQLDRWLKEQEELSGLNIEEIRSELEEAESSDRRSSL